MSTAIVKPGKIISVEGAVIARTEDYPRGPYRKVTMNVKELDPGEVIENLPCAGLDFKRVPVKVRITIELLD